MARGGYTDAGEPLGWLGCLLLMPFYLFGVGYILEVYGYGGRPWTMIGAIAALSLGSYLLAHAISRMAARNRKAQSRDIGQGQ